MSGVQRGRHVAWGWERVMCRGGGWVSCSAYIDHKNLLRLPPDIANAEVVGVERGWIRLANRSGGLEDAPCVYLDIKQGS